MVGTICKRGRVVHELYMNTGEAALALRVTPRRIVAMIGAGQLPAVRRGVRGWAIERAAVEELAKAERPGGRPRKDAGRPGAAAEIVLDRAALSIARDAALLGLPYVAPGGVILSPQLVAYAAGLADAGARQATYVAGDAEVRIEAGGAVVVRLFGPPEPSSAAASSQSSRS